jgi:hypothetical protein
MRKEIGITVPYRRVDAGPLSKADIETLALTMEYLYKSGYTKAHVKAAIDAWWAVKKDKK